MRRYLFMAALFLWVGTGVPSMLFAASVLESPDAERVSEEDMLVTAKSIKGVKDLGVAVSVISADEIARSNAESIEDVLVQVPGINLGVNSSSISGRQNVSIRGSSSSHVLILVDGKKVSGSDAQIGHSDFQYNWVPMNAIERIEVIKGPMSSIYGSQAIGGVINIITKKSADGFYAELDLKYGASSDEGGDTKNASVNIGGQVSERLSLMVSAEHVDLDATEEDDDASVTKIEGTERSSGMLKLRFDLDDTQYIEGSYSQGEEDRYQVHDNLYYDIERWNYSLGYRKQFESVTLDLDGYVVDSDTHYNSSNGYTHNMTDSVARAEIAVASFANHYLVTGAEYKLQEYDKEYDLTASAAGNFDDDVSTTSAFLQDEISMGEHLVFTLGLRYDYNEIFEGEYSPKVNALYKIGAHRIKASYGEGFMAPTLTQGSSAYIVHMGPYTFQGNDDLQPETSKSYEVGYEYHGDNTVFKSALYYTEVTDLINYVRTGMDNVYSNVDSAKMQGFECEISQDIGPNHNIRLGYHYSDTEDEDTGEDLSYRPRHSVNARLISRLPWDVNMTLSADYTGRQEDAAGEEQDPFTLYNLQLSKTFYAHLTVRLGVDNISDEDLDNEPYDVKGRLIYVGLNYRY